MGMARCADCIHHFICETLKGKVKDTWAEKCVAYMNKKNCVEVVRCKDCKYYEIGKDYLPYCNHWDGGIADYPREDDFCSYGERKDNG